MNRTAACAALVLALAAAGPALAQQIAIADTGVFPESLTSTAAGDVIFGSIAKGGIYRARPGETTARLWIDPKVTGTPFIVGVFADDAEGVLYACSAAPGQPAEVAARRSALKTFDLNTGAARASYPMPFAGASFCNDIAVDQAGDHYVSDTNGGAIHRLRKGASALEVWIKDARLAGADGIAVGGDGNVYVNSFTTHRLFRVAVNTDGSAGAITELKTSLPLDKPDGLRALGGLRFAQAEGGSGRVDLITVSGDQADIRPLKENEPGLTAVTVARGSLWAVNAKLQYMQDKALQGQDPGPFFAEAVALPK